MISKNPKLHISLDNKTKEEVLVVLQGISRYIEGIHLNWPLVCNEGKEIISFLFKRYPQKEMFLDVSSLPALSFDVLKIIKSSPIKNVIISAAFFEKQDDDFFEFFKKSKKKIVVAGKNFNFEKIYKYKIEKVFYLAFSKNTNSKLWKKEEIQKLEHLLKTEDVSFLIGFLNDENIKLFDSKKEIIFVNSKDISYSFNPIETCKKIVLKINSEFNKKKD